MHAAHRARTVVHRCNRDVIFFVDAVEVCLDLGLQGLDHCINAGVDRGQIGTGTAYGSLLITNQNKLLELNEMIDRAAHSLRLFFGLGCIHDVVRLKGSFRFGGIVSVFYVIKSTIFLVFSLAFPRLGTFNF